ncbi:GPI inositol deacylase precursor, putative [Trypanosoma brucei gambiense DAL972]|uniref:GPI inositol deacylase, putative n=1 Tax=Trypanosoma brucei gambiense (strain MHOM/CI/86/DAL972) TaxID=679716 RepID=D0A2K3_TRYB9|nr:GPI inositol deacylase precursor, putative [Trypanosoma brucei gambiense DAL972]CBH15497.1 GPI inositol deacylase precursor, putative [Trypanosoma brucei gambiense DAL972]|eukprot:XP_011777761.1 GPI inositol deacylase precursor, putative [Trypanosoma brucei gambiense DAL972]
MSRLYIFYKLLLFTALLQLTVVCPSIHTAKAEARESKSLGSSDTWGCVLCTAVVATVSQLGQLHQIPAKDALGLFCSFFRSAEAVLCKTASLILLEGALQLIDEGRTPDKVCQIMKYCDTEECILFPPDKNDTLPLHKLRSAYRLDGRKLVDACRTFPTLCRPLFEDSAHDKDGDRFSTYPAKRGTDWRGRDCDDDDARVYPGRNSTDSQRDENCNGIYGVEESSKKTYEELWCSNSSPMGVIAVGDSATADFGIPLGYVSILDLSSEAVANIIPVLDNEIDWPMLSGLTGFANSTRYEPDVDGPMTSVYSKLVELNRCNHRDYQNLGHNGARSGSILSILDSVARNRSESVKPAYVFFSMVGNDVCPRPQDAPTPLDYYHSLSEAVKKADSFLPPGSHVLIVSLVDARAAIGSIVNRIHPIGTLNSDVTYGNLYDYLNCLQVSPCWGWLNSNESVRNETWERASAMNAMISRVVDESTNLENVKVHALGDVIGEVVSSFEGPLWKLVNPVDGFHPSQIATALMGARVFAKMQDLGILPTENPFNGDIQRRFGDQGGY